MFALTTLVYPALLAALCLGAGLLVDRASGEFLPGALLPVVGAAALIAVSQLSTDIPGVAPATPYAFAVVAATGFALGRRRVVALVRRAPKAIGPIALPVVAYLAALAPVLLSGRPTFSGYGALPDSALHMIGADYLITHGQHYAHLDLRNSYGQYISSYFDTSYPSGSHTLFGGSARLLGLPLIWALQPFCAFILATATGPAWLLVRRLGLPAGWAALAGLTVTLPALVYGYELVASLKEVTTLPMILALGALAALHPRWLRDSPVRGIPFALVAAAGVSALGLAFGPWLVAAVAVLAVLVAVDAASGDRSLRVVPLLAVGSLVGLVAAWPTWADAAGSLRVATGIASTSNPGNLTSPLHVEQLLGTWLSGSYRHRPGAGLSRVATYALVVLTTLAGIVGAFHLVRSRAWILAGWLGLLVALWVGLTLYGTTWTDAKLLMLTSPIALLLAWAGVAGLWASSSLWPVAPLLGLAIAVGVIASDVAQYRGTDLAPTQRYEELALLNTRFAGRGPVLFTDFDEWSLYALRDLDIGGPDFVFRPVGLADVAHNHGDPVDLDLIGPKALRGYRLIIMRRDPTASRPPAAYTLAWEGHYYQVWARRPGAPAALAHLGLSATHPTACVTVEALAQLARADGLRLVAAKPIRGLVRIGLGRALHPTWVADHPPRVGLVMTSGGQLTVSFTLPHDGRWSLWLQGEIMPRLGVLVDGRLRESVRGQVSGNSFNQNAPPPLTLSLAAGPHQLILRRGGSTLAPGDDGSALLHAIFLTPAGARERLEVLRPASWPSLCGRRFDWIETTTA
ncbi:MAG: hypothetical protein LC685_03130 [Actinobacteria bacterium]|nr:hypothetical protein [Actinomycetota bacterium]